MRACVLVLIAIVLSACAGPDPQVSDASAIEWSWEAHADRLKDESCPRSLNYVAPSPFDIRLIEAERGSQSARDQNLKGLRLVGAWQMESDKTNFGGLSGLDVLPSGTLLAITDRGGFAWIELDPETGLPNGDGAMTWMSNSEGDYLMQVSVSDAEGLSYRDGLALVSYERTHRIEAFAIDRCGNSARAARVADLNRLVDGSTLGRNRGAEGLALDGDSLVVGFEKHRNGGSPYGTLLENGSIDLIGYTTQPSGHLMTAIDKEGDLTATVFRAYDPVRGGRVFLYVDGPDGRRAEAYFREPLPVDNFEGVAIGTGPTGQTRIWVISDNNFSRDQRTLLLALDLEP